MAAAGNKNMDVFLPARVASVTTPVQTVVSCGYDIYAPRVAAAFLFATFSLAAQRKSR